MKDYLNMIPPETVLSWIVTLAGLGLAGISGAGGLFALWFRGLQKRKDEETRLRLAEMESRLKDADAKREKENLEIQARLDETQSDRELRRLFMSQLDEERKDNAEQRKMWERHLEESTKIQREFLEVNRGIQANTAGTFEMLKIHRESDEIGMIKQDRIIEQNKDTHANLKEISADLAELRLKLESLTVGRVSDRKILEEAEGKISKMMDILKRIEERPAPPPVPIPLAEPPPDGVTSVVSAPPLQNEALQQTPPENKDESKEEK